MKLARHPIALCLLALAPLCCRAQTTPAPPQNVTQKPAPIVRAKPSRTTPAPATTTPSHILTKSFAVPQKSAPAAAPSSKATLLKPKPHKPASAAAPKAAAAVANAVPGQIPPGPFYRSVILLDPAHGGTDTGARIGDSILEKDVTLAFAFKLRSLLAARGFNVVMTRDSDAATEPDNPAAPLTLDDRAGIANHVHPVACLLLHATGAGSGVHLYSSELDAMPAQPFDTPWLTAQAAWVLQSQRLQKQLAIAISRSGLPLVSSQASVRPMDSLTCPAVIVELAPNGTDDSTLTAAGYQQQVAQAIANAMIFWQNQAQPPPRLAPPQPPPAPVPTPSQAVPPEGAQP